MTYVPLAFAPAPPTDSPAPTYSLLTLPPALLALLSSSDASSSPLLEIRGHTTDAAVLVTPDQTYTLRGVQNSNSLCLCSQVGGEGEGSKGWFAAEGAEKDEFDDEGELRGKRIEIETVLHETLEVLPSVARTERLPELLKGSEYRGEDAEAESSTKQHHTFNTLRSLLPASDREIRKALRLHRVVTLANDTLRPLPPSYLLTVLPSLLSLLAPAREDESMPLAEAQPPVQFAPGKKDKKGKKGKEPAQQAVIEETPVVVVAELDELLSALDAVDCGETAARGLLRWFAVEDKEDKGRWSVRVNDMVREVGIGLLEEGGYGAQRLDTFLARWMALCGGFSSLCSPSLLASTSLLTTSLPPSITYLPTSRLSIDPSTRFTELFALKPRWRDTDMIPFLDDLVAGEKKKRDAMVLKFVRKVKGEGKEAGVTWWTARNLW